MDLIERGEFSQVPLIVGGNMHEGQLFLLSKPNLQNFLAERWNQFIPSSLLFRETDSHDEATDRFARTVREEFFEGRTPDLETERDRLKLIELHGDAFANYASTKFARMVAATSSAPVYEYRCGPTAQIWSLLMLVMYSVLGSHSPHKMDERVKKSTMNSDSVVF